MKCYRTGIFSQKTDKKHEMFPYGNIIKIGRWVVENLIMFIIMNGMATTYTRTSQPVIGPRPVGSAAPHTAPMAYTLT